MSRRTFEQRKTNEAGLENIKVCSGKSHDATELNPFNILKIFIPIMIMANGNYASFMSRDKHLRQYGIALVRRWKKFRVAGWDDGEKTMIEGRKLRFFLSFSSSSSSSGRLMTSKNSKKTGKN